MNIYYLARIESDEFGYDEMCSCVVVANDEQHARECAKHHAGDEGGPRWLSSLVTVRCLGASISAELELVCRDFHAG